MSCAGPIEASGPCPHDVIDDICTRCTADNLWRIIVEASPSKHLQGELAEAAFGCRLYLAEAAMRHMPLRYLEIGVRRGHSLALTTCCADVLDGHLEYAVGVDAWIANYGDEPNEGKQVVYELLEAVGAPWQNVSLMTGDSHEILPMLADIGEQRFNLILVDGDHTNSGAMQDLVDAWPMLEPGGELVFDDAVAGGDNRLLHIWRQFTTLGPARPDIMAAGEELEASPAFCWLQRSLTS